MELIASNGEAFHLGFADLDALLIAARVERTFDCETSLGCRRSDPFDHGGATGGCAGASVLRDVAEQPVLDLVPFRCAGRIVMDMDHEAGLVGEVLQFDLPEHAHRPMWTVAV